MAKASFIWALEVTSKRRRTWNCIFDRWVYLF